MGAEGAGVVGMATTGAAAMVVGEVMEVSLLKMHTAAGCSNCNG